jgi:hypothetical protein
MAASLWRRLCCCLTGHDYSITSDDARMFVRCNNCGCTSHGLEIDKNMFRGQSRSGTAGAVGRGAGGGRSDLATP